MQMDAHMYAPVNKTLLLKSLVVASTRHNACCFFHSWIWDGAIRATGEKNDQEKNWQFCPAHLQCGYYDPYEQYKRKQNAIFKFMYHCGFFF